jgi:hypothetical protein
MSPPPEAPYEQILSLGISGLGLARQGLLAELDACQRARAELMASLPEVAPAQARAALERCLVVERHLEAELRQARLEVLGALGDVRRAQRAAAGYAPAHERVRVVCADA